MKVPGMEKPIEKDLAFPVAEFEGRLGRVRERMAARDLDALLVTTPENIYYLSGYHTPGYYCSQAMLVPMDGDPIVLTRGIEETNARMLSWLDRSDSYMDDEEPMELFAETLKGDGFAKSRIGIERISWFLTLADFEKLSERLPEATFVDGSMVVEACRVVKSEAEIACIREAARMAEAGMAAALSSARAGVTEANVAAEIHKAQTDMASEYPGLPVFVTSGVRTSLTHGTWTARRIEDGDPVFFEISGCHKRYSAALLRCGAVGAPTERHRKMADASIRSLERMIEAIRPGRPLGDVWQVWADTMAECAYEGRFKRTGYSIGINFPPDWGEGYILCFKRGETRVLEPNMTFHIPSSVKQFGDRDASNSETVRVTEDGCEVMTTFERRLFACPAAI